MNKKYAKPNLKLFILLFISNFVLLSVFMQSYAPAIIKPLTMPKIEHYNIQLPESSLR